MPRFPFTLVAAPALLGAVVAGGGSGSTAATQATPAFPRLDHGRERQGHDQPRAAAHRVAVRHGDESLFAIGAGSQVVAADDQSDYPKNAPKTTLSGFTPNVEAIVAYRPDLVIASYDPKGLVEALGGSASRCSSTTPR